MDRHELAWAAGFFDGEGWAAKNKTRGVQARINQADDNGIPAVLIRFQAALDGLGAIAGPFRKPERRDLYSWTVSSRTDVALLFSLLRPWLGFVKSLQFATATGGAVPVQANIATNEYVWRAWAAGLFDGEGSTYLLKHRAPDTPWVPRGRVSGDAVLARRLAGGPSSVRCGRQCREHRRPVHAKVCHQRRLSVEGRSARRCRARSRRDVALAGGGETRAGPTNARCRARAARTTARQSRMG